MDHSEIDQPKSCAESTSWQGFSPHDAQSIVALKIRPVFSFDDYARLQSIWATQQSEIQAHQEKKSIIESTLSDDPQAPASSSTNSGPECGICYEPITITTARVLVCSHGFCSKCINLMFDNIMAVEEDGSKIIICPICRNQTAHMTADTIGKIFWSV